MTQEPEPWLRSTRSDLPALLRAVLHALDLARENVEQWTPQLTDAEAHERPFGLTPFAYHVRHIGHSLDRLLTYAEGRELNVFQKAALSVELEPGMTVPSMLAEFRITLREAEVRVAALPLAEIDQPRWVGGKRLPTTLAGLLVHLADHTQRHAGQAVTTAKLLVALRDRASGTE